MKSRDRATSKLLASVRQDLNMYALAVGLAGVSLMAQPSEAKIVYTPAHIVIGPLSGYYNLDLNHDGTTDFTITNVFFWNPPLETDHLFVTPARGNGIEGVGLALALNRGDPISSKGRFYGNDALMVERYCDVGGCRTIGHWYNVANRYLGLKFLINRKVHYGWARLSVQVPPVTATLTGYAYETIPGKSIVAGRTKGPEDDFVPDASLTSPIPGKTLRPASLAMLALGAQGVPLWRRKKSAFEAT